MENPAEFNQAYRKAADYCAGAEHCMSEVKLKLAAWSIPKEYWAAILDRLCREGFIDEARYAASFAGGKFRINEWGKIKIAAELRIKSIPQPLITEALGSIDEEAYALCLKKLLTDKLHHLGAMNQANKQKAARYAASKGFEPSLVFSLLNKKDF